MNSPVELFLDIVFNIFAVKSSETFQNTGEIYYEDFISGINTIMRSLNTLDCIFQKLISLFESGNIGLFQFFQNSDVNGDGYLTKEEFLNAMNEFGIIMAPDEAKDIIEFLDESNDNKISYIELEAALNKYMTQKGQDLQHTKSIFSYKGINESFFLSG